MPRPPEGATGVSSGTTFSEVSERPINGPKVLIVMAVTDVGYVQNRFDMGPNPAPIRSCFVEGVFADADEPIKINRDIKLSFDERSNLVAFVTAIRGGKPPADDEPLDPGEIVGVPIQITIESRERKRDGGYWLSMKTPTALMDGVNIPDCIAILIPDAAAPPFVWKTEDELASIRTSLGAASPAQGDGDGDYNPQDDRPDFDELPF